MYYGKIKEDLQKSLTVVDLLFWAGTASTHQQAKEALVEAKRLAPEAFAKMTVEVNPLKFQTSDRTLLTLMHNILLDLRDKYK